MMKTILKIKSGSHLYGTATPSSDVDYLGIFIPDVKYYTGLEKIEELDMGVKSVGEDGKNTGDAIDCKLYELRHYTRLALKNNPNMLEMLFVNDDNVEEITPEGQTMRDHAHLFPYAGLVNTYFGYAKSQEHKMTMKVENRGELLKAQERLIKQSASARVVTLDHPFKTVGDNHIQIGDIQVPVTCTVHQALTKYIGKRLEMSSWRQKMRDEKGYDCKFASHLIRLLLQAKQLLTKGTLTFPIPLAPLVTDIKTGKYSLDDVLGMSTALKADIRALEVKNTLPKKPRYEEINTLLQGITSNYLLENL